jgi:hypothetical protein
VSLIKPDGPKTQGVSIDASTLAAALALEMAALIADRLRGIVALGDDAILGEDAAAQALNKSRSTLEAWRSRGLGPRWVKLGPRGNVANNSGLLGRTNSMQEIAPLSS